MRYLANGGGVHKRCDHLRRYCRENTTRLLTCTSPGSIPERSLDGKIYNSSPTFSPAGKLVALHRKVHLFDINVPGGIRFQESETLTGGNEVTIIETDFGKIGVGICYDVRFPELAMIAARRGAFRPLYSVGGLTD